MTSDFDSWYALYPRKVAKGAARKAYAKALKIASHDVLCAAARAFSAKQTDKQFIPYPATWLNQERWLDEEATPKASVANADAQRSIERVKLALAGRVTLNFDARVDVPVALSAGAITKEEAKRLGL